MIPKYTMKAWYNIISSLSFPWQFIPHEHMLHVVQISDACKRFGLKKPN